MTRQNATPLEGALIGALFCLWIVSPHLVVPTEITWLMKTDWHFQFLSWHLFRSEPWHWPPGAVERFYHNPNGTSIGYTDSIPLVAFALKPFSRLLPMPFQYIGLWWVLCFALQGLFGVLLMRIWTRSSVAQLAGATLLVLMPILLARLVHPSLCAHWTILWSLWLYLHPQVSRRAFNMQVVILAALVGLIHPYLAAMVLAVLAAAVVRHRRGLAALAVSGGVVLAEWWLAGLFLLDTAEMTRGGLTLFSMNVLAIITPSGWSRFMPAIPMAPSQDFEGFQYLGLGGLAVVAIGAILTAVSARTIRFAAAVPLVIVGVALTIYALSPRITVGGMVLADYSSPTLERLAYFRVTGRFFWPVAYALLVATMGLITTRLPARWSSAILALAVLVQFADLRPIHAQRRALARDQAFLRWDGELTSPVWSAALPHYDHLVLFFPAHCGGAPTTFEGPAYLAGFYGLSVNAGMSSRWSNTGLTADCKALEATLTAGHVDDRTVYLVHRPYEATLRRNAPHLVCGDIDNLRVCVTSRSYQYWRNAADFR